MSLPDSTPFSVKAGRGNFHWNSVMSPSRRVCCCGYPCEIFVDDFNRDDSDNLGSDWVEKVVDCDIKDNTLECYSGATNGLCYVTGQANPYNTHDTYWTSDLLDLAVGDVFRIIVVYQNITNYLYAELTVYSDSAE